MSNECITDYQNIKYCKINGEWYVGNNTYEEYAYTEATPGRIIIPEKTSNGENIRYIGFNAFNEDYNLYYVKIYARVISIKSHAFANCPKLEYINIPSTVTTIEANGIQCWSWDTSLRKGTLIVAFEYNSSIQNVAWKSFAFKENVILYICNEINPIIGENVFVDTSSVTIYSTQYFTFNNITTTLTYTCSPSYSICTHCIKHQIIHLNLSKFLLICLLIINK